MIKTLNIVNGDTCINIMKKAGIDGDFLPWKDFLHEGPIPIELSLEEFSKIRAKFITHYGLGTLQEINLNFLTRNLKLASYHNYKKIILWFEHDLYDQLQLLQILSWFSEQNLEEIDLKLISTNNYLGESSVQAIKKLLNYETPILEEHLSLANKAWLAFGQTNPQKFSKLVNKSTALLPFLKGAIYRMIEEYPNTKCGLSRTEYQALMVISSGINTPLEIFNTSQDLEERRFMGDVIFWKILENFEKYKVTQREEEKILITSLGEKLLNGEENWINIKPLERYIGGVKLTKDNLWCWDMEKKTIEKYYYSKAVNTLLKVK
ncbi:MAG: Unknown protein [uncultured Sulfurovum sp.]|uniref:DUF1835 domain-containing protein n=1 Tax=uncultured Sulfurovum sp. TaxID=269237 RepID=A0A6S6TJZ0_9BACT|nr:MAG: Unknown protein [uncultured Sulfurovum sp.]